MLAAIVPVATDWALTVPVVTVEVMYLEPDDPPNVGWTTARATAPTPTRISPIAINLSFIRPRLSSRRVSPAPCQGQAGDACDVWPAWLNLS